MRLLFLICLLPPFIQHASAQPVKAAPPQLACEALCAELFMAIQANPGQMVMRLEDALVINSACAGELVTTAMDAVNADPAQMSLIFETALEMAPERAAVITAAVKHYTPPVVVTTAPQEEVRRAELPAQAKSRILPGEELRRAELPFYSHSPPMVEVRRAEIPAQASTEIFQPGQSIHLMSVPRAKLMR
ncbi:MAG: hypothetical protein Q8M07_25115 [Prosthecobacter sp.]|nr:hypothetical protein [Prosthecobacter sp.]HBJ87581.1 hypothetical protein [Verrucomicrobiales bacterium]